jgi:glycerol-3-phosphate dehydrogenase (NAD(P)+)
MGDLVATCSSPLSRNRSYGENLGRGLSLADAAASTSGVTEGVKSAGPVLELARAHAVEVPITEVVAGVTRGQIDIVQAAVLLASRSAKPERYGV